MRFQKSNEPAVTDKISDVGGGLRRAYQRRTARRWIVVVTIIVAAFALAFADRCWINADGIVVGQLTPVSPISQVRITQLRVKCLDYVSDGQAIADMRNDITAESGQQELQQLEIELAQAREEAAVADQEAGEAAKYHDAQAAVSAQLQTVYDAENALLKKKYVSELVWEKSKADVIKADADTEAAQFAIASKQEDSKRATLEANLLDARISSLKASPELMGDYQLLSPKSGYLTQCNAFQGQIVNPDSVLYQIFNPTDAFVIVFVDPSDANRLVPGEEIPVKMTGFPKPVTARVNGFYPEYSGLPAALTRYFWEEEKWSQFEPVRLDFVDLNDSEQKAIRASAEASISLWRLPNKGLFGWVAHLVAPTKSPQDVSHG